MKIKSSWGVVRAKAGVLVAGGLIPVWLAAGCGRLDGGLMCGEGTVQQGNVCVADSMTAGGGADPSGSSSSSSSSSSGSSSGWPPPPPPVKDAGREKFLVNLYPLLMSCVACHSTGVQGAPIYMTNDAEGSYAKIKTFARIFNKSSESSLPSKMDHSGATVSDGIRAAAKAWLDSEFSVAPAPTPPPVGDVTGFNAAIQEFIKCMREDDWEQNMKFFPMIQTQNVRTCAGCHEDGNSGTYLNADFNDTFKAMKTLPYVYRLVTAVFEGGNVDHLEASDRLIIKGQKTTGCFDPENVICHDLYNVPKVQAQGLKNFQSSTLSRIHGLKCTQP